MKKKLLTFLFLLGAFTLQAQDIDNTADTIISPQYFIAVIAGVLLAMGFQFILTALSVAAGISAVGDVREKYVKSKNHPQGKKHFNDDVDDDDDDDGTSTGTMITTGFGIWSIITVGLSLFGATALALKLSLITSTTISITLGLVIWATFFILLFYLESKMVNSLIGTLINTATAGLRASGEAVKSMFSASKDMLSPSREKQIANVAEDTVDKIRKDFQAVYDPQQFNEAIDKFFNNMNKSMDRVGDKVDNKLPNYDKVKRDIEDIVNKSAEANAEEQEKHNLGGGSGSSGTKWMAVQQVLNQAISQSEKAGGDQSKTEQLKNLAKELKEAYQEGGDAEEKLEKVVAKLSPAEEEQIKEYVEKVKDIISKAKPDTEGKDMNLDLDMGNLQKQIWEVIQDPSIARDKMVNIFNDLDRDTVISLLASNTALEKDQINKWADKIIDMFNKLKDQMMSQGGGSSASGDKSVQYSTEGDNMSEIKKQVEVAVFKFLNHTGESDLDFSMLKNYFMGTMDNPKDSLRDIKNRLSNLDKDSVMSLVKNNGIIEQEHIDKVVDTFEDAKATVLEKVQTIEDEANKRIENTKRKAVIQAENARKVAAAAAWWLVLSAVLSAGAAIGGSLVAIA